MLLWSHKKEMVVIRVLQNRKDCFILRSSCIFDAVDGSTFDGFIVIKNNRISQVGTYDQFLVYQKEGIEIIDLFDKTITPGFCDVHTFFSGWVLQGIGIDFTDIKNDYDGIECLKQYYVDHPDQKAIFGHCLQKSFRMEDPQSLTHAFPNLPIVIFTFDRDYCWMNEAAKREYGFDESKCYAEMIWKMMKVYLNDPMMKDKYLEYVKLLNSKGITSIKEMSFDDYYGFADVMETLEKADQLNVRVSLMSQPVGEGINIAHGQAMCRRFQNDFVRFSGYNRMSDRSIPSFLGELKEPYTSRPDILCDVPVEWELIEKETKLADSNGFRFSLHAQGDSAVAHIIKLYDQLEKVDGKLKHRHSITDLEFSDPKDLETFGKIGGICEIYPQIQSLDQRDECIDTIYRQIGEARSLNYWNRKKMWDSNLCVSCGTDLPLLFPDIGESIYCGCGGYFPDGGEPFLSENTISIQQMLMAWSRNGQYNCMRENELGTLEVGKLADIAIFDQNIFKCDIKDMRNIQIEMTISDGRIVYHLQDI